MSGAEIPRRRDADRTRAKILEAAIEEFAAKGLDGARVDTVAERADTSKRMIFHYFDDKAGLYRAALETSYARARTAEAALQLSDLSPVEALTRIVEHTFDYDEQHPAFVRLVAQENLAGVRTNSLSGDLQAINAKAVRQLETILALGQKEKLFTRPISPVDLHFFISALCYFRVSNQRTFGAAFGIDLSAADQREHHKKLIVRTILELVGSTV